MEISYTCLYFLISSQKSEELIENTDGVNNNGNLQYSSIFKIYFININKLCSCDTTT